MKKIGMVIVYIVTIISFLLMLDFSYFSLIGYDIKINEKDILTDIVYYNKLTHVQLFLGFVFISGILILINNYNQKRIKSG